MKKRLFILPALFLFNGCTLNDTINLTRAVISENPSVALKSLGKSKVITYANNPKKLKNDIEFINNFFEEIASIWGKNNTKLPKQKEYVKYMQNYKSRASIDFDKGIITVETIDTKNPKQSLQNAIVTTLLLPDDPRAADLFGVGEIKLGETPYLLGEVKDDQNKNIRYEWRANRFADILIKKEFQEKTIKKESNTIKVFYVEIPMVKDHANIRVAKFKPLVQKYAKKFNISENLIYSIIKTESNFNQFAMSNAGAIGLMQVVPKTAGRDTHEYLKGSAKTPTSSYLFNAKNNIEMGTAYLKLLNTRYLVGIYNEVSKEYCVISAYNTGAGNVLKTFSANKKIAKDIINSKSAKEIYDTLKLKLPYEETRNYLKKVIENKKEFINI